MIRPALLATVILAATPARAGDDAPALCSLAAMLDDARAGLASGSDAYRRYLGALLQEAALTLPEAELLDAVATERDPAALELLGRALATRASNAEDPGLLQPLLDRAVLDGDPALRAAAVRALRATAPSRRWPRSAAASTTRCSARTRRPRSAPRSPTT